MKYIVEIKENFSRIIDIEADNEEGAIREVKKQYMNEDVVLNAEDHVETEFSIHK